jgi:hypothetical protein
VFLSTTPVPDPPAQHRPTAPKVHGSVAASRTPPVAEKSSLLRPVPHNQAHTHIHTDTSTGPAHQTSPAHTLVKWDPIVRAHITSLTGNGNRSGLCAEASGKSDPFLSLTCGSILDNSETNSPPQVSTTDAGPGPHPLIQIRKRLLKPKRNLGLPEKLRRLQRRLPRRWRRRRRRGRRDRGQG